MKFTYLLVLAGLFAPSTSNATFSVVGHDTESGQMGGALASCTSVFSNGRTDDMILDLTTTPVLKKGKLKGIVRTQSFFDATAGGKFAHILEQGISAERSIEIFELINNIPSNQVPQKHVDRMAKQLHRKHRKLSVQFLKSLYDQMYESKQFVVLDKRNGAHNKGFHTGEADGLLGTPKARAHAYVTTRHEKIVNGKVKQGKEIRFGLAGNTLTSEQVIDSMKLGITSPTVTSNFKCGDLAERLFTSLVYASKQGNGDLRCINGDAIASPNQSGITSNESYMIVYDRDGKEIVRLTNRCSKADMAAGSCEDALTVLTRQYQEFRQQYGCKR